jgi:hypothetical protein
MWPSQVRTVNCSSVGMCLLVDGHFTKSAVWKGALSQRQNTKTSFDVNDKESVFLKDCAAVLFQNLKVKYLVDYFEEVSDYDYHTCMHSYVHTHYSTHKCVQHISFGCAPGQVNFLKGKHLLNTQS